MVIIIYHRKIKKCLNRIIEIAHDLIKLSTLAKLNSGIMNFLFLILITHIKRPI